MPLQQDVLDAAVVKYTEYIRNGFKPSEIRTEIKADAAKYKAAEIDEIFDTLYSAPPKQEEEEDGSELGYDPGEPNKPVVAHSAGLNRDYEEWSVDPQFEEVRDAMDKIIGQKVTGYEKLKKQRVTRLTKKVAEELNSQSLNSRIRLYPIN